METFSGWEEIKGGALGKSRMETELMMSGYGKPMERSSGVASEDSFLLEILSISTNEALEHVHCNVQTVCMEILAVFVHSLRRDWTWDLKSKFPS